MLKKLKWKLFVSLSWLMFNCTPQPPDVPVCEVLAARITTDLARGHTILTGSPACIKNIGEFECGHCVYIVSGKEVFIGNKEENFLNKKSWKDLKESAVLLPAEESYAPLSAYIINSCHKYDCDSLVDKVRAKFKSFQANKNP